MLPVLDKPVLQYIVEEMVESGIEQIIFVTSSQKRAIEDHFDRNKDFEAFLKSKGKLDRLQPLIDLTSKVQFFYTRQSAPLGNGHALLCARHFVGDEPFAFSDGDSIIDAKTPVIKQLMKVYNRHQAPVIGVQRIEDRAAMTKYGNVFAKQEKESRLYKVQKFVEKPAEKNTSPHGLIIGGMRYIFTKDIWKMLEKQGNGKDGEIWVADAANEMARKKKFLAYEYDGQYFDTGNKGALLTATLHFAQKDPALKEIISSHC